MQNSLFDYNFIMDFTFKIQHLSCNIFSQFISYKVTYLTSDWHVLDSMCDFKESLKNCLSVKTTIFNIFFMSTWHILTYLLRLRNMYRPPTTVLQRTRSWARIYIQSCTISVYTIVYTFLTIYIGSSEYGGQLQPRPTHPDRVRVRRPIQAMPVSFETCL